MRSKPGLQPVDVQSTPYAVKAVAGYGHTADITPILVPSVTAIIGRWCGTESRGTEPERPQLPEVSYFEARRAPDVLMD